MKDLNLSAAASTALINIGPADPYAESVLVERMRETHHVTALDLDGTDDGEEDDRNGVNALARRLGGLVYASARSAELMMSDKEYARSVEQFGFNRPRALKPVELLYQGQVDPHAMCPFGGIPQLLQPTGGFASDHEYAGMQGMHDWYADARLALTQLDGDGKIGRALAPIEHEQNYELGLADVTPLPFRIQLDFTGPNGYADMVDVLKRITSAMQLAADIPQLGFNMPNIRFFDESNPAAGRYTLYLAPPQAAKGTSVNRLMRKAATTADLPHAELSVDVAGDTFTDISMLDMLQNVRDFRFLLAGGSRLAPHFDMEHELFGTPFGRMATKHICKRFEPTNRPGHYVLLSKNGHRRTFVNGDIAYPGLTGAQSVKAFLEERT